MTDEIIIDKQLTIIGKTDGTKPGVTISAGDGSTNENRIFNFRGPDTELSSGVENDSLNGKVLTLQNLILKNGRLADDNGGAIYSAKGKISANNCYFEKNVVTGSEDGVGEGGAVYVSSVETGNGGLTAVNCRFTENGARRGGAVAATHDSTGTSTSYKTALNFNNVFFAKNNSTRGNDRASASAILAASHNVVTYIVNSTFYANTVTGAGGNSSVISSASTGNGNNITARSLIIIHSTLVNNATQSIAYTNSSSTVYAINNISIGGQGSGYQRCSNDGYLAIPAGSSTPAYTAEEIFGTLDDAQIMEDGYLTPIANGPANVVGSTAIGENIVPSYINNNVSSLTGLDLAASGATTIQELYATDALGTARPAKGELVTVGAVQVNAPPKSTATLTVTNTNASGDGSLSDAIAKSYWGDTIKFDDSLFEDEDSEIEIYPGSTLRVFTPITIEGRLKSDGSPAVILHGGSDATDESIYDSTNPSNASGRTMIRIMNVTASGLDPIIIKNVAFNNASINGNGAAVYANGGGDIVFENCSFERNRTRDIANNGGALYSESSVKLTLSNCVFKKNYILGGNTSNANTVSGGAAYIAGANALIENCLFEGNYNYNNAGSGQENGNISGNGGALYVDTDFARIINSIFTGNFAATGGAVALGAGATNFIVDGCLFENNVAVLNGGAVISRRAGLFINSSFIGNEARNPRTIDPASANYNGGSAIYQADFYPINVVNSTFYGNKNNPSKYNRDIAAPAERIDNPEAASNAGVITLTSSSDGTTIIIRTYHCTFADNDTNGSSPIFIRNNSADGGNLSQVHSYNNIIINNEAVPPVTVIYPKNAARADVVMPSDANSINLFSHTATSEIVTGDGSKKVTVTPVAGKSLADIFGAEPQLIDGRYLKPIHGRATGASELASDATPVSNVDASIVAANIAGTHGLLVTDQRGIARPVGSEYDAGAANFGAIEPTHDDTIFTVKGTEIIEFDPTYDSVEVSRVIINWDEGTLKDFVMLTALYNENGEIINVKISEVFDVPDLECTEITHEIDTSTATEGAYIINYLWKDTVGVNPAGDIVELR